MMKYLYYITLIFLFYSCIKDKDNVDISGIELDIDITRTEQLLFADDSVNLKENIGFLKKEHTNFMDIYSNYVLNIGTTDNPEYENYLKPETIPQVAMRKLADKLSIGDDNYWYLG